MTVPLRLVCVPLVLVLANFSKSLAKAHSVRDQVKDDNVARGAALDTITKRHDGGYADRELRAETCSDVPGWYDRFGEWYDCKWYADSNCPNEGREFENFGLIAQEACCACGGGQVGIQRSGTNNVGKDTVGAGNEGTDNANHEGTANGRDDAEFVVKYTYRGKDGHACRFDDSGLGRLNANNLYYEIADSATTLEACQKACSARSDCTGVEFHSFCELWKMDIGAMMPVRTIRKFNVGCYRKMVARNFITGGERLEIGEIIQSPNAQYKLMMQDDGDLVLHDLPRRGTLWKAGTGGDRGGRVAVMQVDGNLAVYARGGKKPLPLFETKTGRFPGAWLSLENNGGLVLYDSKGKEQWRSRNEFQEREPPNAPVATSSSGWQLSLWKKIGWQP